MDENGPGGMPEEVIRQAFFNTDEEFLLSVEREWQTNPKIVSVGSCCLDGILCNGMLHVANDLNVNDGSFREDLIPLFQNDPNIVGFKQNIWRVRGLVHISRSIGDAYLKRFDFSRSPLPAKFIQS
ncbi:putative protein phosphatase 2C family, PPM-type phosphatase domain superfamily [Helianthus anomalus]